jgi:PAS domain S-box-containing protein
MRPAEEELSLFFALSHDPACLISLDGRLERVNPAWEVCLGWAPDDLLFRPFLDFVHPDDRAATAAEIGRIAGGATPAGFENRIRGKDGADRRLQWKAIVSPARGLICAAARDVTAHWKLQRELIEASDREKERMGRELHDGLCQNLAGIAALSATLARKLGARDEPEAASAAEITTLLQQAIGDARDLARGLNPTRLTQIGLAAALLALAANVEALHLIGCAFAGDPGFPRLDPAAEAHLYRIAQEAVSNAVAHGRAKRIEISLQFRGRMGSRRIRDEGVGMPNARVAADGYGLGSMDYRARLIGASMRVERASPRGTKVVCRFPLPAAPAKDRRHARKPA